MNLFTQRVIMAELPHPKDELPFIKTNTSPFLYPSEQKNLFDDLGSNINLFLSKKIKEEIMASNSSRKWSRKIEARLVAKILPELKRKFPTYCLKKDAIKKIWEKVSYYLDKIQGKQEAFNANGKLNLKWMIKTSLKHITSSYHVHPYKIAQRIGITLSECIASLEGERVEVAPLTKLIWSVQKHLIKNLPAIQATIPDEGYDQLDKLIVKIALETIATQQSLDFFSIKRAIFKNLTIYSKVKTLLQEGSLTATLAMILANKLYPSPQIGSHFSIKEKQYVEDFITHHVKMGQLNSFLVEDRSRLELAHRILALYMIVQGIPKNLSESAIKVAIHYVKKSNLNKTAPFIPTIHQGLFVFIHAIMDLIHDKRLCDDVIREKIIIEAYKKGCALPPFSPCQLEHFEVFVWKIVQENGGIFLDIPADLHHLFEKELGNILIGNPKQSFKMIINHALQFFKKIVTIPMDKENMQEKVDHWVAQNDMLIRTIHFDPKTPLLKIIEKGWKEYNLGATRVNHDQFIAKMKSKTLQTFPLLSLFEDELTTRLWILYKYLWYTTLSDGKSSTYERFFCWHQVLLKGRYPNWSQKTLDQTLTKLLDQLIPFAPYEKG